MHKLPEAGLNMDASPGIRLLKSKRLLAIRLGLFEAPRHLCGDGQLRIRQRLVRANIGGCVPLRGTVA